MTTPNPLTRTGALLLPMSLVALLAVRCSGDSSGAATDGTHSGSDNMSSATISADSMRNAGSMESANSAMNTETNRGTPKDPTEERMWATTDLNGVRATLVAELEEVRDRLNVGTMTEEARKADKERAAELALGLERVDRALTAIGAATDATWSTMRESQLKEVEEVRAWMRKYQSDNASASN